MIKVLTFYQTGGGNGTGHEPVFENRNFVIVALDKNKIYIIYILLINN